MADLVCTGLGKAYLGRAVLEGADLHVPSGTMTAILGASGSGKTTLLRLIGGFIRADAGTIAIGGRTVADGSGLHEPPERRAVGYVAQEGALFPHLTVAENIGFGLPRGERKRGPRIEEAVKLVGLDRRHLERTPHELSGGEQRRVALARALAPRPAVVLFDEPFSALDPALRAETRAAVLVAMAQAGATGVLVTHDQAEALSMGREVGVLRAGRLVQVAEPAELYRCPADLEIARFLGDASVLEGRATDGRVTCALGELALRRPVAAGPVDVLVRPEQIRVGSPGSVGVHGTVVSSTFLGPESLLRIALGQSGAEVVARLLDGVHPQAGDGVALTVDGPVVAYPASGGA